MKRYLYILIPVALLVGLIAWRLRTKTSEQAQQNKAAQARKNAPANVTVVAAQRQDLVQSYESIGNVESPFNVKLASKITGRIDYLQAREGDRVRAGQLLVRVDPSEILGQVAQGQATVAEAQQRLAQAQMTTNSTDVTIASQISQSRATVASNQANYQQVKQNYAAQVAAAHAAVVDAQGRVNTADAAISSANAAIRSAKANLANCVVLYNRTYNLYKQGFVAAQDVDNARTQRDIQKAAVDTAQQQLSSAQSQKGSAQAQEQASQDQADITATKGKADIEAARQAVLQAQAALRTAVSNRAQAPAYRANLRALQAAVVAAQGQLANAQAQLVNTDLRSSIDGVVTARSADPGATVTAGQTLLTILSNGMVYVTTPVPEEQIRFIHNGMIGQAVFDALPGRRFSGRVTQVYPSADPTTRQFSVRITLSNPQGLIKPGMFARVTFITQRTLGALVVPREAIKQGKTGDYVVVVDEKGVAHRRPVQVGVDDGAVIQVLSGLNVGEQVVTLSLQPVRDDQKVKSAPPVGGGSTGASSGGGR